MLGAKESGFQARSPFPGTPGKPPQAQCHPCSGLHDACWLAWSLQPLGSNHWSPHCNQLCLSPASVFSCYTQEATGEGPSGKRQPFLFTLLDVFSKRLQLLASKSGFFQMHSAFCLVLRFQELPHHFACPNGSRGSALPSSHIANFHGIPTSGRPAPLLHLHLLLFKILKILMELPLCYGLTIIPFYAECAEDSGTPVRWSKAVLPLALYLHTLRKKVREIRDPTQQW